MSFKTEPTGYIKTAVSDLQGTWENLKDAVVEDFGFENSDKLIFHIHEGMSWEVVRDLERMKEAIILIQNIAKTSETPSEVIFWIEELRSQFTETLAAINNGEAK
ncbi:hypothetical protein [Endozoicomonas atrinae]|uniref:hypothetical protein n=1 Tax=Endozoicomonas atrinae TaxID=1333660 RepID=UPI000824F1B2|nr:hypothetical protein [Endozoicomonas atrinae]